MTDNDIRELRGHLGLSQERFARRLGVSLQTVRRWENGLTKPLPIISLKLEELQREAGHSRTRLRGIPRGIRRGIPRSIRRGIPRSIPGKASAGKAEAGVDLGLGGLLRSIGSLFDLVSEMAEESKEAYAGAGNVEAAGGKLKAVYGFSVRMGLGGNPILEPFGNIQETEWGPVVAETREPLVDVLEEGDRLVVVAELPGVEQDQVELSVVGDVLEISASSRDRRYQKELLLPWATDAESLESSYRNGVLEIRLAKLQQPTRVTSPQGKSA